MMKKSWIALFSTFTGIDATTREHDSMKSYLGDAYGAKTRFDYRQTFKFPYDAVSDPLPYWKKTGDVLLNKNLVRLVSSLGGQKGSVFCDTENPHQNWMVEFDFSVYGRSSSGGEGFVFWYVKDTKPDKLDFYGHSSRFEGLALVFDTSDVQNNRYNPFIYGLTNNGRKDITDFRDYHSPNVNIGSCFRQYRNTGSPVYVKILYKDKKLRVDVDIHENGAKYVTCFETIADLPTGYHFGLSGKSDDRAPDDHSFYSFEAYELDPKPKKDNPSRPHEKEDIAAGNEFKMTDKLRQKIIETEKEIMKDYVAKEEPVEEPQLTAQTVRQLEENQFHIIEALNLIQDKLERDLVQPEVNLDALTPDDQNAFENRLNEELKVLGNQLLSLKADLTVLRQTTKDLKEQTERLLRSLDAKVNAASSLIKESNNDSSVQSALSIFSGLAGIALILLAYTVLSKNKTAKEKKFV